MPETPEPIGTKKNSKIQIQNFSAEIRAKLQSDFVFAPSKYVKGQNRIPDSSNTIEAFYSTYF